MTCSKFHAEHPQVLGTTTKFRGPGTWRPEFLHPCDIPSPEPPRNVHCAHVNAVWPQPEPPESFSPLPHCTDCQFITIDNIYMPVCELLKCEQQLRFRILATGLQTGTKQVIFGKILNNTVTTRNTLTCFSVWRVKSLHVDFHMRTVRLMQKPVLTPDPAWQHFSTALSRGGAGEGGDIRTVIFMCAFAL